MSDTPTIRIGISSARELEIQVDDPAVVSAAYEKALKGKDAVLWVTDMRGHRFGISVTSIAFIELEEPQNRGIGFSAG